MQIKAKRIDKLQEKVKKFENNLVVKYLNNKGYKCDTSMESMKRVSRIIRSEKRNVIIERLDEKLFKSGSYFIWDGLLRIKLIDILTGKEV